MLHLKLILATWLIFTIGYIIGHRMDKYSFADILWGPSFIALTWFNWCIQDRIPLLIPMVITLWGLRLFIHISRRNIGQKEDYRYIAMRKNWGKHIAIKAYFNVFMIQGLFMFLISYASLRVESYLVYPTLRAVGICTFIGGLLFETIADEQLRRFVRHKQKGEVMTKGLWHYTRHPNYFGEATLWWGIYIIAIAYGSPIYTVFSPLVITILVRYVSGVPLLEERYKDNPQFQNYAKKTSIFIPFPPKK